MTREREALYGADGFEMNTYGAKGAAQHLAVLHSSIHRFDGGRQFSQHPSTAWRRD